VANPTVVVDFVANTRQLQKGISSAGKSTSGFGSKLKSLARTGAFAAGAAGVGAIAATLKIGIGEWSESTKVAAQTEAVLKSTGKTAGVTATQVSDLAESIMKKSGIDDEAVASGENLLLTFTDIRNEVGKGNDIFNQATQTMADMSTALGQDMKTSAIQLGKALNNPTKGVTALSRVGVSFTKAQKDQIKALQDSGKTMEAQKIILKELNKEFGGSAEAAGKTLPGQLKIVREEFNNFAGMLVGKMVPVLQTAIAWLRDHWPEISKALKNMWNVVRPLLDALIDLVIQVVDTIRDHWGTIGPIVMGVARILEAAVKIIAAALRLITALLRGDWSAAWDQAKVIVEQAANLIKAIVQTLFNIVKAIFSAELAAVKAIATAGWNQIKAVITGAVDSVVDFVRNNWKLLTAILTGPFGAAAIAIATHWDKIENGARTAVNTVRSVLAGLGGAVNAAVSAVSSAAQAVANALEKPIVAAVNAIKAAAGGIAGAFTAALGGLKSAVEGAVNAIKQPINALIRGWNSIQFTIPTIHIPSVKVAGHKIGGGSFGGQSFGVPRIPELATGGVISQPTLAMVGEGAGREIVAPESLLRQILAEQRPEVRVFIGDQELRGLVRYEVRSQDNRTAQTLLAGAV